MSVTQHVDMEEEISYPESDGLPMADNTRQFRWIVMIKENLETLFHDHPLVFVAGDLLWYPVKGYTEICRAPDTMVVFGRPKGDRGSYLQWEEEDIGPQVVFEVVSPGNTLQEMLEKREFYEMYGVEEFYLYNPETNELAGQQRRDHRLRPISSLDGWTSPRLGIRFDVSGDILQIFRPDGERFLSHQELRQQREQERVARQQAEAQREQERVARQQAEARVTQLTARLRELGIDVDA